jgi:Ran GTPase-activating protein (RanGAP) involved in mRNA processing and transport
MGAVLQLAPNKNHTSNAKVSSVQINRNPCKPYANKTFFQREIHQEQTVKQCKSQQEQISPERNFSQLQIAFAVIAGHKV